MRLVLYHDWDSFQSIKVRLSLAEKGLDWSSERVAMSAFANLTPDYLARNPSGLVPTLVADTTILTESSVMIEFLDDAFPAPPLRPADPLQRALMRQWIRYQDDVVHPAVRVPTFNLMIKQRVRQMSPDAFERVIAGHPLPLRAEAYRKAATSAIDLDAVEAAGRTFQAIMARIDHALRDHLWLAGDLYSLADVALASFVDRIDRLHMATLWSPYPQALRWCDAIRARASYGASIAPPGLGMPPPDPDLVRDILRRLS